jgi:hypothetical protein
MQCHNKGITITRWAALQWNMMLCFKQRCPENITLSQKVTLPQR